MNKTQIIFVSAIVLSSLMTQACFFVNGASTRYATDGWACVTHAMVCEQGVRACLSRCDDESCELSCLSELGQCSSQVAQCTENCIDARVVCDDDWCPTPTPPN